MKFLSLVVLSGLLSVSCAHKKDCAGKESCDKKEAKACCKKNMKDCKDGSCKKEKMKTEANKIEKKADAKKKQ